MKNFFQTVLDRVYRRHMVDFGPLELLILQPTPYCNLACKYCYLSTKDDKSRMSLETIEKTFMRVLESKFDLLRKKNLTVVWHAGEPMVVGVKYYTQAFELIAQLIPPDIRLTHSFQTNATLITQEWCDLFNKYDVSIGVSVDGPAALHDLNRLTRSGKGSHSQTAAGIAKLKEAGVQFHTISVLTAESLKSPELLFEYFNGLGIGRVCFNIEEKEGVHSDTSVNNSTQKEQVENFFLKFHQLILENNSKMTVRELDASAQIISTWSKIRKVIPGQSQESHPLSILNVAVNGDYSTFSPEMLGINYKDQKMTFGNVYKNSLDELPQNALFKSIYKEIVTGIDLCRMKCDYYGICGGGAPSNKLHENQTFASTETDFCRLHKQVPLDLILDQKVKLSDLLRKA